MNRKRLILFVLSIVFVLVSLWSYMAMPRQKTVSQLKYAPGGQLAVLPAASAPNGVVSRKPLQDGRILNIAELEQQPSAFKGYRRNIFKPIFADEARMLKPKFPQLLKLPTTPSKDAATAVPVTPAQPDVAPLARFTFMGFLKKDARKTIFLANESDIILVKKGDKILGRYEATSISDQALTLVAADTGDEIVIPLIENQPLGSSR